ncbi:MAG: preprotein translocase subunit SecY [Candidatus Ranarchaeia archaeon]
MPSRLLLALKPLMRVMPEIRAPDRKISFKEKVFWTAIALLIYLVMSQIPLYGVDINVSQDYFRWLRVVLASSRGTLMELGIGPIVTAGLIMQLLAGSQLIHVNFGDSEDRALFTGSQKVMSFFMIIFNAFAYILAGAYGTLTLGAQIIVMVQLFFGGLVALLLDEMLQKGWGLGSGISLFIAANVCQQVMWGLFSPFSTGAEGDGYFRGAVLAIIQVITVMLQQPNNALSLFQSIIIRPANLPGLAALFATVIIFMIVVYIESVRVELPLASARYRGFSGNYPIKLLYTSNIPVILTQAMYANALFMGQILQNQFNAAGGNFWIELFAKFQIGTSGYQEPVPGCLIYYITPPRGIEAVLADPVRAAIYSVILIGLCAGFSSLWIEVAGLTPRDIARQLVQSGVVIPGFRRSPVILEKVLDRYIPTVALLGGVLIGLLATFADFLNALGTGPGILLTVGILFQYYQIIAEEQVAEMGTTIRGLLG